MSHLLGDEGSDSEEEEGGGAQGGTTTSVELEFDLRHYLQRYVYTMHNDSVEISDSVLWGFWAVGTIETLQTKDKQVTPFYSRV